MVVMKIPHVCAQSVCVTTEGPSGRCVTRQAAACAAGGSPGSAATAANQDITPSHPARVSVTEVVM